jgi:uncharacterized protein (DUF302 family)
MREHPKGSNEMNRIQRTISVRHVSISIEKTFSETCSRFESRMGHIDYATFTKMLSRGESEMAVRDHIKGTEGPLGLMIFNAIDHGVLLSLAGKTARAKQYVVGNPLFALQMTEKDIRAGLYAPLRIYIREEGTDKSVIEYDLPSTLFGQFQNAEVDQVAMMLDQKLEAAIDYVST